MSSYRILELDSTDSTNRYLKESARKLVDERMVVAVTDYQSAGRGMGKNTWESENGKNLLFSFLVHPVWLKPSIQYILSMAEALAIHDALYETLRDSAPHLFAQENPLTIKWPNDIYWKNCKLSGTLIDGTIKGMMMADMVIGTGINVNQTVFLSDAPNPISLAQIAGREFDRQKLLNRIAEKFLNYYDSVEEEIMNSGDCSDIIYQYHKRLYRREGLHPFCDINGSFMASIVKVNPNGIIVMQREDGTLSEYEFKEVRFLI